MGGCGGKGRDAAECPVIQLSSLVCCLLHAHARTCARSSPDPSQEVRRGYTGTCSTYRVVKQHRKARPAKARK